MRSSSAEAIARGQSDSAVQLLDDIDVVPPKRTAIDNREERNHLRAQMIVETLTPFLGVLVCFEPENPPSKRPVD